MSARTCRTMRPDAKRDYLITYLSDMILLSKAAEAKTPENADFKRRAAFTRNKVLMEPCCRPRQDGGHRRRAAQGL